MKQAASASTVDAVRPPQTQDLVHRWLGICLDGYPFILIGLGLTLVVRYLGGTLWAIPLGLVTLWMIWFFRDPDRESGANEGEVISPADGKIIDISEVEEPYFNSGPCVKVSVFMNIFNVHVNRIPFDGKVTDLRYQKGKFLAAYAEKASQDNEQMAIRLETSRGAVVFSQIAGLVARRIVCRLKDGQRVARGQRFGLIRFGSRVDLYLPKGSISKVHLGQSVFAGRTILGEMK